MPCALRCLGAQGLLRQKRGGALYECATETAYIDIGV
jgi:hypothetical protein